MKQALKHALEKALEEGISLAQMLCRATHTQAFGGWVMQRGNFFRPGQL